jgi:ABC-type Co2+ transport system permease subunit
VSDGIGLACLPNIGPHGRRRRMVLAGIAAAIAVAAAAFALPPHMSRVWRLAVFLPAWVAAVCYLEARSHTCVVLAARGLRNLDTGNERVADAAERRASAAQSRSIYLWSTVAAAVVTASLMFLP